MSKKKSKNKKSLSNNPTGQPQKTVSRIEGNTASTKPAASAGSGSEQLLFGRKNFMFLLGGIILITIGYLLMAGGSMPSPDVWDEDLIYGTRRTLIAPIFILAGLALQVYTIFAKK